MAGDPNAEPGDRIGDKSASPYKRGEVFRAVLDVLRIAEQPLTSREISEMLLRKAGIEPTTKQIRDMVGAVRTSLRNHQGKTIERAGEGMPANGGSRLSVIVAIVTVRAVHFVLQRFHHLIPDKLGLARRHKLDILWVGRVESSPIGGFPSARKAAARAGFRTSPVRQRSL